MSDKHNHKLEQRRSFRVAVHGVATVSTNDGGSHRYGVTDVSLGGVGMRGETSLEVGACVVGVIQVPGLPPIDLRGRVVRVEDGARGAGVEFTELNGDAEDLLHDVAVRALEREPSAAVMVVHHQQEVRCSLSRQLRALGTRVIVAATPLEVLTWLAKPSAPIAAVAVDMRLGLVPTHDLLRYVADAHPQIQRYVIADADSSELAEREVITGFANGMLSAPWDGESLADLARQPPLN